MEEGVQMSPMNNEEIENKIKEVEKEVEYIKIDYARVDERLKNVESSQGEIKLLITNTNSQVISLLSQVLNNQNQRLINEDNNKTNKITKIIAAILAFGASFFAGKNL
jgi:septal ring factor EnvC (AmiA/AmiB activator)